VQDATTEFGAHEALESKPFVPASTFKAATKLAIGRIPQDLLSSLFGKDLPGLFESNKSSHEVLINKHREKSVKSLQMELLAFVKYLGAGSYGAVHLVQNKENLRHLALKSISKKLINNQTAIQLLVNEKDVLSFLEFPLVISLEGINKEENFIHFIMEFVDGIGFDEVLMRLDQLSEWQTCFYVSQVVLMLQYLHRHGIIYRDLKAQNIICGTDVSTADPGLPQARRPGHRQVPPANR